MSFSQNRSPPETLIKVEYPITFPYIQKNFCNIYVCYIESYDKCQVDNKVDNIIVNFKLQSFETHLLGSS